MELAAAGYFERFRRIGIFNAQADIGIQHTVKTVAQVAGCYVFALLPGKRTVVHDKVHRDRRFGDPLEWDGLRVIRGTEGVADMNVGNTGDRDNGTDAGFRNLDAVQALKLVKFAYFYFIIMDG